MSETTGNFSVEIYQPRWAQPRNFHHFTHYYTLSFLIDISAVNATSVLEDTLNITLEVEANNESTTTLLPSTEGSVNASTNDTANEFPRPTVYINHLIRLHCCVYICRAVFEFYRYLWFQRRERRKALFTRLVKELGDHDEAKMELLTTAPENPYREMNGCFIESYDTFMRFCRLSFMVRLYISCV